MIFLYWRIRHMTFSNACKICILLCSNVVFFSNYAFADDLSVLQLQCADIGFKIKTPENGKCVLALVNKLRSTPKSTQSSVQPPVTLRNENDIEAAKRRNYERQLTYEKDAEITQKKREIEALERRQNELMDLQRRSVAAQEKTANRGSEAASLLLMQKGLEMMGGGQTRKPTTCMNLGGGIVTCN
jgi:hypothetical protein